MVNWMKSIMRKSRSVRRILKKMKEGREENESKNENEDMSKDEFTNS